MRITYRIRWPETEVLIHSHLCRKPIEEFLICFLMRFFSLLEICKIIRLRADKMYGWFDAKIASISFSRRRKGLGTQTRLYDNSREYSYQHHALEISRRYGYYHYATYSVAGTSPHPVSHHITIALRHTILFSPPFTGYPQSRYSIDISRSAECITAPEQSRVT